LAPNLGGSEKTPAAIPGAITTLDNLDAQQIPTMERFAWQPKELVAVIGSHRWRNWGMMNAVAFSPGGATIASGGEDGVRLWNKDGQEVAALNLPTHSVNALTFRPDGHVLLAGGEDGMIHAWDMRANPPSTLAPIKPSPLPERQFRSQPDQLAVDAIAFAPGGKLLACSVGRQTNVRVVLWDATVWPPRELPALPDATGPFAFSADGKMLVTQERNGNILVWDLTGERPQKKAAGTLPVSRGQMLSMALAPDGATLVTCHNRPNFYPPDEPEGDVILWDLTLTPPKPKAIFGSFKSDPRWYMTPAAVFSRDGKTLAFAAHPLRHRVGKTLDLGRSAPDFGASARRSWRDDDCGWREVEGDPRHKPERRELGTLLVPRMHAV
jgi:WD40 repeat protein